MLSNQIVERADHAVVDQRNDGRVRNNRGCVFSGIAGHASEVERLVISGQVCFALQCLRRTAPELRRIGSLGIRYR